MERRLEKIRSWKRCSVGSSNRSARNRSLESGEMLWRLNQELLPDPGSPIASTTTPFEGRGVSASGGAAAALATRLCVTATADDAVSCGTAWAGLAASPPDSTRGVPLDRKSTR